MSRKINTITIKEGRDRGKIFKITEWDSDRAAKWAQRLVFAAGAGGLEVPPEILELGSAALVYVALPYVFRGPSRRGLKLLGELMECAERVEAKAGPRPLVPEDIEEPDTHLKLQSEVLKLTFGFFVPAASQTSATANSGGT